MMSESSELVTESLAFYKQYVNITFNVSPTAANVNTFSLGEGVHKVQCCFIHSKLKELDSHAKHG